MSFAIFPRGGNKKHDAFACECDVIDVVTSEHRSDLAVNAFCKIQQLTLCGDTLVIADGWYFLDGWRRRQRSRDKTRLYAMPPREFFMRQ